MHAKEAVADEHTEEVAGDKHVADEHAEEVVAHEPAEEVAAHEPAEVVAAPKKKTRGRVAQLEKIVAAKETKVEELKEKLKAYEHKISEVEDEHAETMKKNETLRENLFMRMNVISRHHDQISGLQKGIAELKSKNAEEVAVLIAEVEKLKGLLENVDKHVEVRRQQEALIKKRNDVMSKLNQEIHKATDESVATLQAV